MQFIILVVEVPGRESEQIEEVHPLIGTQDTFDFDTACHGETLVGAIKELDSVIKVEMLADFLHDSVELR